MRCFWKITEASDNKSSDNKAADNWAAETRGVHCYAIARGRVGGGRLSPFCKPLPSSDGSYVFV